MKLILVGIVLAIFAASCANEVKCRKLGLAKEYKNAQGELCNSW